MYYFTQLTSDFLPCYLWPDFSTRQKWSSEYQNYIQMKKHIFSSGESNRTIFPIRFVRTLNQCWWQVLGSPIQGDFFFEVVVLFGMTRQWHSMIHVGRPINHQKFSSENYAWLVLFVRAALCWPSKIFIEFIKLLEL